MTIQRTRKVLLLAGAIAVALGLLAGTALAHHSFTAEFDPEKPLKMSGKISRMTWANPHAWIYIDVEENGKTVTWGFEMGGANGLIRNGWRKEDLPVGTVLTIEGWQARNGTNTGNARSLLLPDGRRLFAGTSNPASRDQN